MITDTIKKFIDTQKLSYVATISPDNTPNLSPKGTLIALDDENLAFADIRSPQTMINLKTNPTVEINVIDPLIRRGFRFKGTATILRDGAEFSQIISQYKKFGIKSVINAVVKIKITSMKEVTSPLYDLGYSEDDIKSKWKKHFLDR